MEFVKLTNSKLINADRLAKSLDFPNSAYLKEVEEIFGNGIINEKGTLNREILGNIIYNDFNKKVELDKITFKYVVAETEKKIKNVILSLLLYQVRIIK